MKRLGLLTVFLLAGCVSVPVPEPSVDPPAPVVEDYSALADEFGGNGSWVAGEEIQPGRYFTEFDHESCKWFKGNEAGELISWGESDHVLLDVGETIEVQGCSVWVLVP